MSPDAQVNPAVHGVGLQRPLAVSHVSLAPQEVLVQRGLQSSPGPVQATIGDGRQS
jgi:hypothetical protein